MRYATVAPSGKVLGIFTCEPDLLSLRTKPDDAEFIECPEGSMPNVLWDGAQFVERQSLEFSHSIIGRTLTITGLPADSIVDISGLQMTRHIESGSLSVELDPGAYIVEIDPWPNARTSFPIYIDG